MRSNALAALAAARALGVEPRRHARRHAQRAARPAHRAAGPGRRHRRLLQRQPDVDARRPRRPRRDRVRAPRRRARRHARARARRAALPRGDRRLRRERGRRPAGRGRPARRAHGRALRRRDARRRRRRGRGGARRPSSCARRHRARQGVARRRPRGRLPRACARRRAPDGRGPDRRHGVAADLHLPDAEVHRVPAPARVRPAHPRGGARGPPRQGRHADDGRDHHLHGDLDPVPDAVGLRLARRSGSTARRCLRAARLRRRLQKIVRRRSLGSARG